MKLHAILITVLMFASMLVQANIADFMSPENQVLQTQKHNHQHHKQGNQQDCCTTQPSEQLSIQLSDQQKPVKCENSTDCDMLHCNTSIIFNHFDLSESINLLTQHVFNLLVDKPTFTQSSLLRPPKYQA
ncbi:MAG: hypothetical protein HRU38_13755 [Saccharospirillaceae bacterium]|nr:hypothetical protein [Pseudomonadales bacterium]NRB79710.1 hypothetical protein [Saccharospirillaceae bacterium]